MSNWSLVEGLWGAITHFISQNIGISIGAFIVFILTVLWKKIKRIYLFCRNYFSKVQTALNAVAQKRDNGTLREGDGLWTALPVEHPDYYQTNIDAAKVLSIANLKGGVGKTTIASNLGACLSQQLNEERMGLDQKPVLLIDLDFQGTLSGMARPKPNIWPPKETDSHATRLISNTLKPENLIDLRYTADERELLEIIPSYYELAQAENRLMIEWLLGAQENDIRYTLANILHRPQIRHRYSLIIIDCPPRLTTATIQALCASSHLLIPTIMDGASAGAVNSFARQVETYKQKNICPYIQHIGVVGSIANPVGNFDQNVIELEALLNSSWENGGVDGVVTVLDQNTFIPRYKRIAENYGRGIVYPTKGENNPERRINKAIESLATIVRNKMNL